MLLMSSALLVRVAEALALKPKPEATEPTWEFAGYRFDLAGHSLNDPSGKEVPLRRSEFRLLRVFVECAGRVLSRDQLLNLIASRDAEPYERSVDMQISRLRCKIELDLRRPSLIVTVPGSGYKFAAAVREAKPREPAPDADPTTASVHGASSPAVAAKRTAGSALSIVVLPFANIGGDPTQDYFTDGVTESLTTDLSRIRDSFVIARNTAFAYKGKPMDVRVIGRELNVRYVLEGSVQRSGDRMRVSAQLIDAESGGHLWAERFDEFCRRSLRSAGRNRRTDRQHAQRADRRGRGAASGADADVRLDGSLFSRDGAATSGRDARKRRLRPRLSRTRGGARRRKR